MDMKIIVNLDIFIYNKLITTMSAGLMMLIPYSPHKKTAKRFHPGTSFMDLQTTNYLTL